MGWWSTDIMGGDSPLDFEISISSEIGLVDPFQSKTTIKEAFEKMSEIKLMELVPKIVEEWGCGEPGSDFHTDETSIGHQVLGVMMMKSGVKIGQELRLQIIDWTKKDSWSKDDEKRKKKVDEFLKVLEGYDETPTQISSNGLLQKVMEKMNGL